MTPHDRAEQVVSMCNPLTIQKRWIIVDEVERVLCAATQAASDTAVAITLSLVREHIRFQVGMWDGSDAGGDPHPEAMQLLDRLHKVFASIEFRAAIDDEMVRRTREP